MSAQSCVRAAVRWRAARSLSSFSRLRGYERAFVNISLELLQSLGCGEIDLDQRFRACAAASRARSYFSKEECYEQSLGGLDFYFFLKDLCDNFDERADEIAANLRRVAESVFDPDHFTDDRAQSET